MCLGAFIFLGVLPTLLISIRDPSAPGAAGALQEVGAVFAGVTADPAPLSLVNCLNCREYCSACRLIPWAGSGDEEGAQGCSPEHRGAAGAALPSPAVCWHWSFGRSQLLCRHLLPLQRWRAQRSTETFVSDWKCGGPDSPQHPEQEPWNLPWSPFAMGWHPGEQESPVPRARAALTEKCSLSPPSQHLIPFKPSAWHLETLWLCRVPCRLPPLNLRNISKLLSRLWLI